MLACGHESEAFGAPTCIHLRTCREPDLPFVRWLTGVALEVEVLCVTCAEQREAGLPSTAEHCCRKCFAYATNPEFGDFAGFRGRPGIQFRAEALDDTILETVLPASLGTILDIAPIEGTEASHWLLLAEDGRLMRFDAGTGAWSVAAFSSVRSEPLPDHSPWRGHVPSQRLHVTRRSDFAAVVTDYGQSGEVIDLTSSRTTLALDGGSYFQYTVPFSFAFVEWSGRVVALHRTSWNRLDASDARTQSARRAVRPAREAFHGHSAAIRGSSPCMPRQTRVCVP